MAVVSLKSNKWKNADGLNVYFNKSKGEATRWGEEDVPGTNKRMTQGTIDLTLLSATDSTIVAENVVLPKGALIEQIEIITLKESTGVNSNLNLGLIKLDDTAYDLDGLLAAGDDFNGGTDLGKVYSYVVGTTDAGAVVGTVLTEACRIVAGADTAVFTAGIIQVRITWERPLTTDL